MNSQTQESIRSYLDGGHIQEAIQLLKPFFEEGSEMSNNLIVLSYQNNQNTKDYKLGNINRDDFQRNKGKIIHYLLIVLTEVSTDSETAVTDSTTFKKVDVTESDLLSTSSTSNPYNFLDSYEMEDSDNFFGRENEVDHCVSRIRYRLAKPELDNIFCLTGTSGSGKSSMLKAGILAELAQGEDRRVACAVLHPADFYQPDGSVFDVIPTVLDLVEAHTGLHVPISERIAIKRLRLNGIERTVQLLEDLVRENETLDHIVIGIDQFEEIIDVLFDQQGYEDWFPLLKLLEYAALSSNLAIVYTLESSRKESMDHLDLPVVFREVEEEIIEAQPLSLIRTIIKKPFEKNGYKLGWEVVDQLFRNARSLDARYAGSDDSSILPIIALRLSHLYDDVQRAMPRGDTNGHVHIEIEDVKGKLGYTSIIESQIRKAWFEGTGSKKIDYDRLDYFLHPLVSLGGLTFDSFILHSLPLPPYDEEQRLFASFLNNRLLTRTKNGYRLIHEAVVRYWREAKRLYAAKKEYYQIRAEMLAKALTFYPTASNEGEVSDREIDAAAMIINSYLRIWSLWSEEEIDRALSEEDKRLREYCYHVLGKSETPRREVHYLGKKSAHVHIAAIMKQSDLLEKFFSIEPESLLLVTRHGRTPCQRRPGATCLG